MREITSHKINGLNEELTLQVLDQPGAGGACHHYHVVAPFLNPVERYPADNSERAKAGCDIRFQNGPISEVGPNGITHEILLAILIDRLEGFQAGAHRCRENAIALTKLQEAMMWLQSRTRERMARGVEGTNQK
jgi:hypothetical protein